MIVTDGRIIYTGLAAPVRGTSMKPPIKRLSDLKPPAAPTGAYARPSPSVARRKSAKVLTAAEKAAFLASRPDLAPKS